jgi:hypothetical protein
MSKLQKSGVALELPPAYQEEDHDGPPRYTTGDQVGPSPYSRFPLRFNLYYNKSWTKVRYRLGESEDAPLYTIKVRASWVAMKRGSITLTQGTGDDDIVAVVHHEASFNGDATIEVPGREEAKPLRCHPDKWAKFTFTFDFDVGVGKETRKERFEWRPSRAGEVRALDKWAWGWKLVRLGDLHEEKSGGAGGGSRDVRPHGETSDGREIVAVWADNSSWSRSKIGKFHFLGAGATGALGDAWALVAVMSALRLWDHVLQITAAAV